MRLNILFICLLASIWQVQAQKSFKPQNLGSKVNSEYSEINPVVSPDGSIIYFIRINHPDNAFGKHNTQDIWFSELQPDGSWGEAQILDTKQNIGRYNAVLGINDDGTQILIAGKYKKNGTYYAPGLSFIYHKGNESWSKPEKINISGLNSLMKGKSFNASLSGDGKFIVISGSKSELKRKLDIYISENDGSYWKKLRKIRFGKSSLAASEEAPFITGENNILYFSSKRENGKGGYDIYVSKRLSTDITEWTEPKLIESNANTEGYESYFKTNGKQTFAYYISSTDAKGGTDIFKIKLKEVNPYVLVRGQILNKATNLPIIMKKDYGINLNGKASDSIKIDYDSAKYTARLPFGKKYMIVPSVKNWTSDTALYDAASIKEYLEVNQDLYVTPLPYAKVSGNLMLTSTRSYLPYTVGTKLYINDTLSEQTKYEPKITLAKAAYELLLPWGKKYKLQYKAPSYTSKADTLDLTTTTEYQEVKQDLYGDKREESVAMATVTGKVINKKTLKPFANVRPYVLQIDKIPYPYFEITSTTGDYLILLPLGNYYTINARATGYYPVFENIDLKFEKMNIKVFKDLIIAPIEVGIAIRMNNIFFQSGKSILDPKSFPELDKLAKFLTDNPTIVVEIGGHTDNVGKPDKNMLLSRWRARAVEQYLEGKGADKDKVVFNGYGMTKPVASNKTPKDKAMNRRVEFTIKSIE